MTDFNKDSLTLTEREEYEADLIAFCDRELGLLGDIESLDVLYAGGTSPLWIEGLAERIGPNGSLTILDLDAEGFRSAGESFEADDLPPRTRFVVGDVFAPPFEGGSFDLVYSAGLFHELDMRDRSAKEALAALSGVLRPGGKLATSDFVSDVPAVHLEDETLEAELARLVHGEERFGIGSSERLVELHDGVFSDVRWRMFSPFEVRYLDRLLLTEDEPPEFSLLSSESSRLPRARRDALLERVRREGYTRPATLYVEGAPL